MAGDRRQRPVPTGKVERLFGMGALAATIGARATAAGARQLLRGRAPTPADLLLAPANAVAIAERLSTMRGAAMKLGQLLSMDAGQVLPAEWSSILSQLQADAAPMPISQLEQQLDRQWGRRWREQFTHFGFMPIAAASIGQVHRATTKDGRDLAIKVQYPGVAASIDSDIDNLVALLRLSRLLPQGIDIAPLVAEARRQLQQEADYLREADNLEQYAALVRDDPSVLVPTVDRHLTGESVLAMSFIDSEPLDQLATRGPEERNCVVERLLRLTLEEVFSFGVMQTDPNFANFRYQPATGRVVLLDFGATRRVPSGLSDQLRQLLGAALAGDRDTQRRLMVEIGYFAPGQERLASLALDLLALGMDAVRERPLFNFRAADLPARAQQRALAEGFSTDLWAIPPVDTLFVHRKIGGMYLLASRLDAEVPLLTLLESYARAT